MIVTVKDYSIYFNIHRNTASKQYAADLEQLLALRPYEYTFRGRISDIGFAYLYPWLS